MSLNTQRPLVTTVAGNRNLKPFSQINEQYGSAGTGCHASDDDTGRFGYGASLAAIRSPILIGEDVF
jgi:hypothetical protein